MKKVLITLHGGTHTQDLIRELSQYIREVFLKSEIITLINASPPVIKKKLNGELSVIITDPLTFEKGDLSTRFKSLTNTHILCLGENPPEVMSENVLHMETKEKLIQWIKEQQADVNQTVELFRNPSYTKKGGAPSTQGDSKSTAPNEKETVPEEKQEPTEKSTSAFEQIEEKTVTNKKENEAPLPEPVQEDNEHIKDSTIGEKIETDKEEAESVSPMDMMVWIYAQESFTDSEISEQFGVEKSDFEELLTSMMKMNILIEKDGVYTNLAAPKRVTKESTTDNAERNKDEKVVEIATSMRHRAFGRLNYDLQKTIALWSPIGGKGVTTITMNLAMYLGMQRHKVAVLEGISNRFVLKQLLNRYTVIPEQWRSWASTLFEKDVKSVKNTARKMMWNYKNVQWFPFDKGDPAQKWTKKHIEHYIHELKSYDIVLVDLPSGELDDANRTLLDFVDELWVVTDNNIHTMVEYKDYIAKITEETGERSKLPAKLIVNQTYSFSEPDYVADILGLPLLGTMPALHEVIHKNFYQKKPLIDIGYAYKTWSPYLDTISESIVSTPEEHLQKSDHSLARLIRSFRQKGWNPLSRNGRI